MTAVSRVSAAQPDAFLLASERGCDTLFVHDAVRQKKCLALQKKSPHLFKPLIACSAKTHALMMFYDPGDVLGTRQNPI